MNTAQTLLIPFEEFPKMIQFSEKTAEIWRNAKENLFEICFSEENEVSSQIENTDYRSRTMCKAKPFIKWAGGKRLLLSQLEAQLPANFNELQNVTYIEPFVGGGAMLFHMLRNHTNITRAVINDINPDLIHCYELIAHSPNVLIDRLKVLEKNYYEVSPGTRKDLYYEYREQFNMEDINSDERAALFIFLNHTCYNGLYRVNLAGKFNVPHGRYTHPIICDEELIMKNHELLNSIDFVICKPGDYKQVSRRLSVNHPNFIYFDPPYRPLYPESNFKEYSTSPFGDLQQEELKTLCDQLSTKGCMIMLSNSDSFNVDGSSYFEQLYDKYNVQRILAPRFINADPVKRKKRTEVLIRNY